ncbi:hypothetical protein LshimejAT787_0703700 [Lyophyllum shimeji]|uniref:Uncharacterized protein n=1 Tax=Lyophyllum shimeji TaxID=47721 RepID=A0A9P3PPV7_LYOSH|nr:hypothetical protein LshimejAT787_0703700 [Lyophyllum shimeji]
MYMNVPRAGQALDQRIRDAIIQGFDRHESWRHVEQRLLRRRNLEAKSDRRAIVQDAGDQVKNWTPGRLEGSLTARLQAVQIHGCHTARSSQRTGQDELSKARYDQWSSKIVRYRYLTHSPRSSQIG